MGINGLLPALKPIAKAVHVSKYRGQHAAVDGYSWLHKGAYCCARELCEGTWTDKYVVYFMSRIQMLRSNGVEPLVVFDGGRLPIKGDEETSRHRARAEARAKAAGHLAAGNMAAAVECYQRCVDITPAMAKYVIEELKAQGVQFIVAPYEADAQMAYLARRNDVQLVITEDSDLLAYGCPRVLYKLDRAGNGEEFSVIDLPNCTSLPLSGFTADQFVQLCVMAGCDFLAQLPGIGLKKAHGVLRKYRSFTKVVKMLRFNGTRVPQDYEVRFQLALWAFRHCRVYCPTAKALVHLAPLPAGGLGSADVDVPEALTHLAAQQQQQRLDFLGPDLPADVARGIAEGQLDPMKHTPYDLAAIFAGCRHPPPHIAAQLPAPPSDQHLLALRRSSNTAAAAGSGGAAAAASGGRAVSGGSKPRVGLSRRHTGQQQQQQRKLSWGAAGSGKGVGAAAAAGPVSGGGRAAGSGGSRKVALGIAKYFAAAPAGGVQRTAAGAGAAAAAAAAGAAAASQANAVAAGAADPPAAGQSMQHNILQALQALQQQKQQRQQQEQVQQQQLLQQHQQEQADDMLEQQQQQQQDLQDTTACCMAEEHAADGACMPVSKRLRLSDELGSVSVGSLLDDAAAAKGGADSVSDDAGMLLDQQYGARTACPKQVQQQHRHHLQQQQERSVQQQQQQQAVDSIDLVVEDSQEDPDDASPEVEHHGRAAAAAGHCKMFSAGARDGSSGGSSELQPGDSSSIPSGDSSLQQGSGMQSGSIQAAPSSGMGGNMMSLSGISQDVSGLHDPSSLSGQLSGQQQQQDADPFGVAGAAAVASRGAAVSTLSALINSMSSHQQQQRSQSPAVPACLQRRTRASSNSRFFQGGGNSSCSPALLGHTAAAVATFMQDEGLGLGLGSDPLLTPSGSLPSLPSSGGVLAGVSYSSGLGISSEAGQGSVSGLGLSSEEDVLAGLGSSRLGQQQQQQQHVLDELDGETAVSPPKTHHLAIGGSSSQAWRGLQRSLRGGTGLNRQPQQRNQPGTDVQQQQQHQQQTAVEEENGRVQQQQQPRQQRNTAGAAGIGGEDTEQSAAPSSSGNGSSSNDENAEPADAGDIHSIAHIKQYAKLANKVVSKVHKQQQQQHSTQQQQQRVLTQQQLSPLGLARSTANTAAAAAAATHRSSGQVASQSYLRSSTNTTSRKRGRAGSSSKGQQQPRKSLTHLYAMRYDPDLLFVPVKPLGDPLGLDREEAGAATANTTAAAAEDVMQGVDDDCDVLLMGDEPSIVDELRSGPFGQQPRQMSRLLGGSARLGGGGSGSSRVGIAGRPFKAPRAAAQQDDVFSTSPEDDMCDGSAAEAGGFGAFGQFACGGLGEGDARLAGGRTAGRKRGVSSSWLR